MTFIADALVTYPFQSLQKWTRTGSINPYPPVRKLTDPFRGGKGYGICSLINLSG